MTELEKLKSIRAADKAAFDALRERSWKQRKALEVTRGNILSLKSCVGQGVIAYDVWLKIVEESL